MRKTAERLPLRLLTPGILLFLLAHAFGSIVGHAPARGLSPATKVAQYLDDGSGNARTIRPARLQVRSARGLEAGKKTGDRAVVPAPVVVYLAIALGLHEPRPAATVLPTVAGATANVPLLRAQNPRDPPGLAS